MIRWAINPRRAIVLCIVVVGVAIAGSGGPATAAEPSGQRATGPAVLWKAFPLNPRPSRSIVGTYRPGVLPTSAADNVKNPLIVTLLLLVIAASSAVLLRPALARVPLRRSTGRVRSTPERVSVRRTGTSTNGATAGTGVTTEPQYEQRRFGTCEIRLWRGHGTCQLYASTGREDEAIAMSRSFRLQSPDTPDANALRALADLRRRLEDAGWTIAPGRDWYQQEVSGLVSESAKSSGGGGI